MLIMVPEVKTIDPDYIATQQERFNGAAQAFGQTYARRQNMFSAGTDVVRRITNRQTSTQQIHEAMANLTEARLNLVEVRARHAAQAAPTDQAYRELLADHFAQQYLASGEEILAAAQIENTNHGFIDQLYRANMSLRGILVRSYLGLALFATSGRLVNLIEAPNAATATEVGVFLFATGMLDLTRNLFLRAFQRNRQGAALATTANLIRRQASIHEGQITGDDMEEVAPINNVLQQRLQAEILDQLQVVGIHRRSDIIEQREALRNRLSRYDHLPELVRSRDVARVSRLTRTLFYSALGTGILIAHLLRPEYCGERTFPNPDQYIETITGGGARLSSWKGVAENEWFKRIYGVDFDRTKDEHQNKFRIAYELDPAGNDKLVGDIVKMLKAKNPRVDSVTSDLFRHPRVFYEGCDPELDRIFNNPNR